MNVYTLTPAPTAQMFPMEDRVEGEWLALRLAFLRSGITGEMEEVMSVLCPSGGGFGGMQLPPPTPFSPVVLELGFILNVTDPYKATLSQLRNVAMAVSDMTLTVKEVCSLMV